MLTERMGDVAHDTVNQKSRLERKEHGMSKKCSNLIRLHSLPQDAMPLWSNILLSACRAPEVDIGMSVAALARIRWMFREALSRVERIGPDSLH